MRVSLLKMSLLAACLSGAGALPEPSHAGDEGVALALIGVESRADGIEIVGSALAVEAGAFQGEMVIDRQGASGSVSTRQARDFVLAAGERSDIARVGVSYRPGERLRVTVTLRRDGGTVSEATLSTED